VLEADEAAAVEEVQAWSAGLEGLHARIAGRFVRAEPRRRALAYLRGLLGNVGRKNGWQPAEHAGEATPDGMQRLLVALVWTTPVEPGLVLAWSRWRRHHQARARRAHYQRREQQVRLQA
jgi:hypothetical protein